jgi:outer membrane protein assembly factor BamB
MNDNDLIPPAGATRRVLLRTGLMLPLLAASGCSVYDNLFNYTKKTLPGKREDVLPVTEGLAPPHGLRPTVALPAPVARDWPVEGGALDHVAGNAALPATVRQDWATSIGSGSAYRRQVTCTPLVVGDTVFTIDSAATVSAFSTADGRRLWRTKTKPKKSRTTNIGGGIGYADGTLYASTGFSQVLAFDPKDGAIRWRKTLLTPIRSAPTPAGGKLFVISIDEVLIALSAKDGTQIWTYDATPTDTTLLGQPAPAYAEGIVVAGFGSGDLVAIRGDTGAVAWTDSIAAASGQVGVAQISAITGPPVVVGEIAIAIGTGGLMVGVDLRAGRRLWEREVSGHLSPLAAGDWVFITSADQQVAAVLARTGELAWVTQLPLYKRPKSKGGAITWTGAVLAGGRLIYTGMRDELVVVDPITGQLGHTIHVPGSITVPPIAAGNTLYLITDDGNLRAYR